MKPSPPAPDLTRRTPAEARAAFRTGVMAPTPGVALGYAQANLVSLPREYAHMFVTDVEDIHYRTTRSKGTLPANIRES
jgi:uncharacterized protein YcsI (UPF0317 family)